ncbi:MAG TPA: peptidyl-prolyl cis-trans isomerase [Holophagaceae bacterium]|nr:peptidyl-prolyl cis-trans isomerase [Holophagaceae bacterium]
MKRALLALLVLATAVGCRKPKVKPNAAQPTAIGVLPPEEQQKVRDEILVIVNSHIVTRRALQQAVEQQNAALYRQFSGKELDAKLKEAREKTLQGLIDNFLLLDKAVDLDIKVPDDYVKQSIEQMKKENNLATDADLEKAIRASLGIGLDEFTRKQKDVIIQQQVLSQEVYHKIAVEDSELRAYYADHRAEYALPARFRIRELVIAKGATPEEQQAAQARMAEVQKALAEGKSFEDLVKQYSTAASRDTAGDLGWMGKGILRASIQDAALALKPGEVSKPLETDKDWLLVQLIAAELDPAQPFEEVKAKIMEKVQEPKAQNATERYLSNLRTRGNVRFMVPKEEILKG